MKTIHWTLPFASVGGTRYRIDIYAEGVPSGGVKTLTGAASPFTTDEDGTDDFFAAVRAQTGHINVVSTDLMLMEELVPSNDLEHSMRLINEDTGRVEWQGFLSSEAYSQSYVGIPTELSLPVKSVLSAMDSAKIEEQNFSSIGYIRHVIANIIKSMNDYAGFTTFDTVEYPWSSWRILSHMIDLSSFYSLKEQTNEHSVIYTQMGASYKEIIGRICSLMGWVARENGTTLYLQKAENDEGKMYATTTSYLAGSPNTNPLPYGLKSSSRVLMSSFDWKGSGHMKTIQAGAKSVEVVANIGEYKLENELPDCPFGSLRGIGRTLYDEQMIRRNFVVNANTDDTFNNLCEFKYWYVRRNSSGQATSQVQQGTATNVIDNSVIVTTTDYNPKYSGAFMVRRATIGMSESIVPNTNSALYVVGITGTPITPTATNFIFRKRSGITAVASGGYLKLTSYIIGLATGQAYQVMLNYKGNLRMGIQIGDYWWNGTRWDLNFATVEIPFDGGKITSNYTADMRVDDKDGYYIPITDSIQGELSFCLYQYVNGTKVVEGTTVTFHDIIIDSMRMEYVAPYYSNYNSRNKNTYFEETGSDFNEEVSVTLDLATDMNNKPSPTLVMDVNKQPIKLMTYEGVIQQEEKRPEKDLLTRMVNYYKSHRRKIELIVERPDVALPELTVRGFDFYIYIPMSESRDWKTGTSTIRCFEAPQREK